MKGLSAFFGLLSKSGHSYMRLTLLVTVPAIVWIGLFGLLGAWRLGQVEQTFIVMPYQQGIGLLVCGLLLLLARLYTSIKRPCAILVMVSAVLLLVASIRTPDWGSQRLGFAEAGQFLALLSGCLIFIVRPTRGPLAFRPDRSALITAILGTFFSVGAAYILVERDVLYMRGIAQVRADQLRDEVAYAVHNSMGALDRLGARWASIDYKMPPAYVEQEFNTLVREFDEFKRLTYLDSALRIEHDKLVDPRYTHVLGSVMGTQVFRDILNQVLRTRQAYLKVLPGRVGKSPVGLVISTIHRGAEPDRFVIATVNLEELVRDRISDNNAVDCCFQVSYQQDVLHDVPRNADDRVIAVGSSSIPVQSDLNMRLNYWHVNDISRLEQSFLPEGVLLFGLAFTFLANSSQRLTHVVRRRNAQLQHRALHDALTGLPNRRMLVDSMKQALELCAKAKDGSSIAVLFVELDGLRLISDTLGHEISDELLKQCAQRMATALPGHATLARLDAGDFVVCVRGQTNYDIEVLTRQLIDIIQEPFNIEPHLLRVTAFAGVTRSSSTSLDPLQLVRQADMAMLEARRRGHRPWLHYRPELGAKVQARLSLYNDLQQAIENEAIELHYQPIIDGHSGAVVVFEVLMRQPHRERGMISPSVFIPMAEESGQIMPLTDWLLGRACQDAKVLEAAGFGHIPLAINISARYFQAPNFVEKIRDALTHSHVAPSRLHLEITESVLLEDPSAVVVKLQQLRTLGVQAGLDDFGTGYSSLAYLRDLPISVVKIDRVFVKNVISEPADAAIVRAVSTMAHHMQLKVVVEGVETVAQLNFLRRIGCDLFQGFLFDRPKPLAEVIARLQDSGEVRPLPTLSDIPSRVDILLVGDVYWTASLSFGLERVGVSVASVMTLADAFGYLAHSECQVVFLQDSLPSVSVESFFSRVSVIYPTVNRWLARHQSHVSDPLDAVSVRLAQRVWDVHPQAQSLKRALDDL